MWGKRACGVRVALLALLDKRCKKTTLNNELHAMG